MRLGLFDLTKKQKDIKLHLKGFAKLEEATNMKDKNKFLK